MTTTANAAATPTTTTAMTIQMDFTHHLIITQHPKKTLRFTDWIQIYPSPQLK